MPNNTKTISDNFMKEMLYKSYADFSKKFKNQNEMYQYITSNVGYIVNSKEYDHEIYTIKKNHTDYNNDINTIAKLKEGYDKLYKNEKIGYMNAMVYSDFLQKVKIANNDKRLSGEEAFRTFRSTYREICAREHSLTTLACHDCISYTRNNFNEKAKDDIDDMVQYLNNTDSVLRGSSDEFKDIKQELKNLKNQLNTNARANHRTLVIAFSAIHEKMEKYIDKRKNVLNTYSFDSYKGKRVFAMEKLKSSIEGITHFLAINDITNSKKGNIIYSREDEVQSNKDIIANFDKQTFSAERYDKVVSFEKGNKGESFVLDTNVKKTMADLLDGCHVSYKGADRLRQKLELLDKKIGANDKGWLKESFKNLKEIKNAKNLEFLDNAIWETNKGFHITGNKKVDEKVVDFMINRIREATKTIEQNAVGIAL